MRRLLLPLLVLSLLPLAGSASAGCYRDPATGEEECHAVDCLGWDPDPTQPPATDELLADPVHAVSVWLLPPACPS